MEQTETFTAQTTLNPGDALDDRNGNAEMTFVGLSPTGQFRFTATTSHISTAASGRRGASTETYRPTSRVLQGRAVIRKG